MQKDQPKFKGPTLLPSPILHARLVLHMEKEREKESAQELSPTSQNAWKGGMEGMNGVDERATHTVDSKFQTAPKASFGKLASPIRILVTFRDTSASNYCQALVIRLHSGLPRDILSQAADTANAAKCQLFANNHQYQPADISAGLSLALHHIAHPPKGPFCLSPCSEPPTHSALVKSLTAA